MPDDRDLLIQATDLMDLGRLEEALAIFQTLLKTDSNNAIIWNSIGIIKFRQGEYREAANAFGQAADINPEFTSAWFNKSLALVHLGKETEALRALDKVLKLNRRDREAISQRDLIVRKIAQTGEKRTQERNSGQTQLRV